MTEPRTEQSRLRRPLELAFILLLALVPLAHGRALQEQTEVPKAALAGIAGALLCALAFLGGLQRSRLPLALTAFLALGVWQAATAPYALSPMLALDQLLLAAESTAFLMAAWLLLKSSAMRRAALAMIAINGCVAAIYGLSQYAALNPTAWPKGLDLGLARLASWGPLGTFLAPLDQTDAPGSFFGHANVAAEFVAIGALIFLAVGLERTLVRPFRLSRALVGGLALACFAVMALFIIRSGSRAVLAGLGLGLLMVWSHLVAAEARRAPIAGRALVHVMVHLAIVAVLLGAAAWRIGDLKVSPRSGQEAVSLVDRVRSAFDPESTTVRERLDLWLNTIAMIEDRPIFGVGPGNFRVAYPEYSDSRRRHELGRYGLRRQPARPHNEYLAALAETGILGGILLLLFLGATILPAVWRFSALRRAQAPEELVVLAALAGLVSLLATACFAFPFQQTATRLSLLTLSALLVNACSGPGAGKTPTRSPTSASRGLGIGLAALVLLVISTAHHRAAMKASADLRRISQEAGLDALGTDRALDQAIARAPGRTDLQLIRAQYDARDGRAGDAESGFRRTLALHPALANAWMGLARVQLDQGRLESARQGLRRAVSLQPREPRIRILAGDLYRSLGDRRAALREYEEALRLETSGPDRLVAYLALAGLHSDADRLPTAMHWLEKATSLAPGDPVVLEARARCFERHMPGSSIAHEAWDVLRRVLPRHAEAQLRCGQAEMAAGRTEDALQSFEDAYVANPNLLVALLERGAAQAALGRLPEARASLIECMRRSGLPETRDPVIFSQARDLIGRIEARAREEGLMEEAR